MGGCPGAHRGNEPRAVFKTHPFPLPAVSSAGLPSSMAGSGRERCLPPSPRTELDAARALADLAHMALLERRERDQSGHAKERSRKRVKNESLATSRERSSPGFMPSKPEDESLVAYRQEDKDGKEDMEEGDQVKIQQRSELPGSNVSVSGGKHNLSEADKEARKMRRVLANRESARRTIRRRQALREELAKRVADLSLDNQNIKTEKEHVMREYQSLRDANKKLKEKVAEAVKYETEPSREMAPSEAQTSTPSPAKLLTNTSPFQPYARPSWLSVPPGTRSCYDQRIPYKDCILIPSYYLPHGAWIHPSIHQPYTDARRDKDVCSEVDHREQAFSHFRSEACASSSAGVAIKKDTNTTIESRMQGTHSEGAILTPSLSTVNPHFDAKSESSPLLSLQERTCRTSVEAYAGSKNAIVAAEARKRRKELTKLKHLHRKQLDKHIKLLYGFVYSGEFCHLCDPEPFSTE